MLKQISRDSLELRGYFQESKHREEAFVIFFPRVVDMLLRRDVSAAVYKSVRYNSKQFTVRFAQQEGALGGGAAGHVGRLRDIFDVVRVVLSVDRPFKLSIPSPTHCGRKSW